jgi:hypothetical protein
MLILRRLSRFKELLSIIQFHINPAGSIGAENYIKNQKRIIKVSSGLNRPISALFSKNSHSPFLVTRKDPGSPDIITPHHHPWGRWFNTSHFC